MKRKQQATASGEDYLGSTEWLEHLEISEK